MNYDQFYKTYISEFKELNFIFEQDYGFIVWRIGTGNNIELLHIKTFKKRQGIGKALIIKMLEELKTNKPYHSIFGFTRIDNLEAEKFYLALGFNIQNINGIYKDGKCKIFWSSYEDLVKLHLE